VGGLFSGALIIIAHTSPYHIFFFMLLFIPLISASRAAARRLWVIGRHVWGCFGCWSSAGRRIHRPSLVALVFLHQASIFLTRQLMSTNKSPVSLLALFRSSLSRSSSSFHLKPFQTIDLSRSVYQI
jgi:hypothetical protein